MRTRFTAARLPLVPAEVAGLVLVLLAALILGGGIRSSASSPATVGLWVLVAGLFVLLGAALATVLIGGAGRRAAPFPPSALPVTAVPSGPSWPVGDHESPSSATSFEPGGASGELRTRPSRPWSSSIPGAYLSALESAPGGAPLPPEDSPPIAAALPLAAMPRAPSPRPGHLEESESTAVLEVELARLRARLLEMEGSAVSRAPVGPRLDVSGGSRAVISSPTALEARSGITPATRTSRDCVDCGRVVGPGPSPSLCSSCGRLLCADCAPRAGTASGLLYCPPCAGRREAPSVSGGRAGPPINGLSSGRAPGDAPSAARG